jgi:flagellar basal-body rod protein FlgG
MDKSIYVALSGALLQEKKLDVLTDNLANANTSGFKKINPVFEDALAGADRLRRFATLDSIAVDFSPGLTERTERPLDVMIKGEGFFSVTTPSGIRYTRDGSFTIGKDGVLETRDGYSVMGENGPVRLGSSEVAIDENGSITENGAIVERLKVVSFERPDSLKRQGNLFSADDPATSPILAIDAKVAQGFIETSNISPVKAMTAMIESLRSYETHTKLIQTIDDMAKKAVEEVGRV